MYNIIIDDHDEKNHEDILEEILKKLLKRTDTPARQYLMQCADWNESEYEKGKWIAYSPIYNHYSYGEWPLYDLGGLRYADISADEFSSNSDEGSDEAKEKIPNCIIYQSWKGDYDPVKYDTPYGNLPYKGVRREFKGNIWTRG